LKDCGIAVKTPTLPNAETRQRGQNTGDRQQRIFIGLACLSSPFALRHEAVFGCAVKRLSFFADCFVFAGFPLALFHKAVFGGAVKWLAVAAHSAAFAGLRHSGADRKTNNQTSENNTAHRFLLFIAPTLEIRMRTWGRSILKGVPADSRTEPARGIRCRSE
jgi:hypothetical protein